MVGNKETTMEIDNSKNTKNNEENHREGYKSIIELNKVIVSLATSILTLLVGYLVLQKVTLAITVFIPISTIVITVLFSLMGFGRSVTSIGLNKPSYWAKGFTNLAAITLVLSIVSIPILFPKEKKSIEKVLGEIYHDTRDTKLVLSPLHLASFVNDDEAYVFQYSYDSTKAVVTYSKSRQEILKIDLNYSK